MPSRALPPPEAWPATWPGGARLRLEATDRAAQRAHQEAPQRAQARGKTPATVAAHGPGAAGPVSGLAWASVRGPPHASRRWQHAWPPAVAWGAALQGRVDRGELGM